MFLTKSKYSIARRLRVLASVAMIAAMTALSGCDSVIYDDEGDCDIHYRLRFTFDYNVLFSDAFAQHVHSVSVYAFNPDGTFAWQRDESGWQLSADGYMMDLDGVPPGDYHLIAWCGMDNSFIGTEPEAFTLPELTPGVSTEADLRCRMERERRDDGSAHSSRDLWPLFHGTVEGVEIIDNSSLEADGQTVVYKCNLKKNTNRVRIILQQLSANDVKAEGFSYKIETDNGLMAHTNDVIDDETITYHAWNTETGEAGIIIGGDEGADTRAESETKVKVAIADLTTARLVKGRSTTLTVFNPKGEVAARIPLVDYALLVKDNYSHPMTDQEFLDREDTYTLTFFLDENYRWDAASIIINSWRVVKDNVDIVTPTSEHE